MVGELPAKADGMSCGTSIAEKTSADCASGMAGCQPICSKACRRSARREARSTIQLRSNRVERLTNVFYVADDAIIDRVTDVVEGAVLMPAGIAVTVEALAD